MSEEDNNEGIIYTTSDSTDIRITDGSDYLTVDNNGALNVNIDTYIGSAYSYPTEKCCACKKDGEIVHQYTWGNHTELTRKICRRCYTKCVDRMFGISPNRMKTEEVLYGDKDTGE